MNHRRFGRTGLQVSEIGLGTSHNFMHLAKSDPARCVEIVQECLACGINFFDTAPIYGESERVLGEALAGSRDKIVLATKVWESSASAARASIERSFKRLRTEVIDLLQIHNMAGWREVTPAMQAFQREGRIRYLGVTDRRPENFPELIEAMKTGAYDAIQIPYYLGEVRCREEVLPLAREMDLGVIVMRPFSHLKCGLLGPGGSIACMPELKAHHDGTPGQALLKYLLADESVSSIIPATGRVGRMSENAAASGGDALPEEIRARLEALVS